MVTNSRRRNSYRWLVLLTTISLIVSATLLILLARVPPSDLDSAYHVLLGAHTFVSSAISIVLLLGMGSIALDRRKQ